VFMLCSDGLTTMVADEAILALVERNRENLQKAAKALVDAANKGGGEDNITIVLFELGANGATVAEVEGVPTIDDTRVVRRDELEAIAPRDGRRRDAHPRRISRAAILVGSGTLVVVLAALVVWSLSRSYFV